MSDRSLSLPRAVALGAIQGPTELLPVSSSAHLSLVPWLAGWRYDRVDPELRKSFEVALHGGTAAALLIGQRRMIASELAAFDARRAGLVALSFVPPAVVGYRFESAIETRLGGPAATAVGLVAGAIAMALADRSPQRRGPGDAGALDGLALGVAQASALAPGCRETARRWRRQRARGFTREQSNVLSRTVALPVIVGAVALKARPAAPPRRPAPGSAARSRSESRASFASTLASQKLIGLVERDRALWPYAAYRVALAAVVAHVCGPPVRSADPAIPGGEAER